MSAIQHMVGNSSDIVGFTCASFGFETGLVWVWLPCPQSVFLVSSTIAMSGTSAFTATTKSSVKCAWDMYDLGASHHTSPCQEDFINFEVIPAKLLTAANKEKFMAEGIGEMMIRLPNSDKEVKM